MPRILLPLICIAVYFAVPGLSSYGQGTTAPVAGLVTDPTGAVVPGAEVTVRNQETGAEYRVTTVENGTYRIPAVSAGNYTVTVSVPGFKQFIARDVKVYVGIPATVNAGLTVGTQAESVTVLGAAEVLQTQTSTVSTTITGRQIIELPFTSRDGLDLILLLPGTNTPGRPRTSTIDGLPKSAINITIDGVNVQDNTIKNSDGFFTYIRPRIDAVEEVTVSTANPGAESAAEGAVQIKFITRSGSNDYHGSLYEYHRNPALNANYWFNNRDRSPDPKTGKAPRDRVLLNQFGFRAGGPISLPGLFSGRDRAFFFVNYEEFHLPEQANRVRNIMHPRTQQGYLRYIATEGGRRVIKEVNILQLAAANGQVSTIDPIVGNLLSDIRKAASTEGTIEVQEDPDRVSDPNIQRYTYSPTGGQTRYFPTVRFDFNLTSRHRLENVWNYQYFTGKADFLNGTEPRFPGFPNYGIQGSNRFSNTTALRSTITPRLVNEARYSLNGGTVLFFANAGPGDFAGSVANQGGFNLDISAAGGITTATSVNGPSRRNAPVKTFADNLTWTRGTHNLNFGMSFTQINTWSWSRQLVPTISFGHDVSDPARPLFLAANQPTNFPGGTSTDASRAGNIYAVLTGRVTQISAPAILQGDSGKYKYVGEDVRTYRMREAGYYVQDSWRFRPNLTLNMGLRWEIQYPIIALTGGYSKITIADVWGESGVGNLFKPGTLTGQPTVYKEVKAKEKLYNTLWKNFAPSFGYAWTPQFGPGLLSKLLGRGGNSVFRGGFSVAFNRDDMSNMQAVHGSAPGRSISATRNTSLGNLVSGTGSDTWPLLFRDTSRLGPPRFTESLVYPFSGTTDDGGGTWDPSYRIPYVMSWNMSYQRELSKDTVVEVRYTGNRAISLRSTYGVNEVNIVENGVLDEFKLAQANLYANMAAGRGPTWAYTGIPGTAPLPIALAYLHGLPKSSAGNAAVYTSSRFREIGGFSKISPGPYTYASLLDGQPSQRANALTAGLPVNFFRANPGKRGGPYWVGNGYRTYYDAATVELRRRMARGLLMQANYVFARSFHNNRPSLRAPEWYKSPTQYATAHAFKANWIYELPIGRGRALLSGIGSGWDRLAGGWEFHGTSRLQTGAPLWISGVRLVGMTRQELQDAMGTYFDDAGKLIYFLPDDIRLNTIKAYNVDPQRADGYSTRGAPSGRHIAPANNENCIEIYGSQCGHGGFTLRGPSFTRFDLSVVKRTRITERVNFELRAEFLNAFNHVNFQVGSPASDFTSIGSYGSDGFARITEAYRDLSTTNDPGGRLIQFVARINF